MRVLLARFFRLLFKIAFFRKKFFGFHKRIFSPMRLFSGVTELIKFKDSIKLELHIDDWIQENIYFLDTYEEAELKYIQSSINEGNTFIDIGANIGVHTLFASKLVKKKGRVISFEPFSKNHKSLTRNISLNNSQNITIENIAISDKEKTIEIYYDKEDSNLGMASSFLTKFSSSEKTQAISLDSYVEGRSIEKIDFIKLDIEGGEYLALLGMKKVLTTYYPKLLVEILEEGSESNSDNKKDIINYLEGIGYILYFIDDNGKLSLVEKNKDRMNFAFVK